jgi:quercetin dioxygenase-like cupin family protein
MKKAGVVRDADCPFRRVDWGQTKGLIASEGKFQSDNLQVRITEYQPFFEHSLHVHPHQEEVIYVISGKGYSQTEFGKEELRPGDAAYVPAGVKHATINPYAEPMRAVIIKTPPDDE